MSAWQPHEDAVLSAYVARPALWRDVLPSLPGRARDAAKRRLQRLRRERGTVWRINLSDVRRQIAVARPRDEAGRFV